MLCILFTACSPAMLLKVGVGCVNVSSIWKCAATTSVTDITALDFGGNAILEWPRGFVNRAASWFSHDQQKEIASVIRSLCIRRTMVCAEASLRVCLHVVRRGLALLFSLPCTLDLNCQWHAHPPPAVSMHSSTWSVQQCVNGFSSGHLRSARTCARTAQQGSLQTGRGCHGPLGLPVSIHSIAHAIQRFDGSIRFEAQHGSLRAAAGLGGMLLARAVPRPHH